MPTKRMIFTDPDTVSLTCLIFRPRRSTAWSPGPMPGADCGAIDSPWGVALAPGTFGEHSDELLVGNFGSGTIMAFSEHGRFEGFLENRPGKPVVIEGLWALALGNGGRGGVPGTL